MDKNQRATKKDDSGKIRKGTCCGNSLPFWPKSSQCVLELEPTVCCSVAEETHVKIQYTAATYCLDSPSISKSVRFSPDVLSIPLYIIISAHGNILERKNTPGFFSFPADFPGRNAKLHWKSEVEAPID